MASLTPPQPPLEWTHSAQKISDLADAAIKRERTRSYICPLQSVTLTRCLYRALADNATDFEIDQEPLSFYQNVSPSKDLREASNKAQSLMQDYAVESSMRLDVYRAEQDAQRNIETSKTTLNAEERRSVEKMILDGKRSGLVLPQEKRKVLEKLQRRCRIMLWNIKNYNEEKGNISFTAEELLGVPQDVISGYTKRTDDAGKEIYEATFKTPDISPIVRTTVVLLTPSSLPTDSETVSICRTPDTRRLAFEAVEERLKINAPILEKMLELKLQIALTLGYETWADYISEIKILPGGSRDEIDSLQVFLGRAPNSNAFIEEIFCTSST